MDAFLSAIETNDPSTYERTKKELDAAKGLGATAVQAAFYTQANPDCARIESTTNRSVDS